MATASPGPRRRAVPLRDLRHEERYGLALLLLGIFFVLSAFGDWVTRLADFLFIVILLLITMNPLVPVVLRRVAIGAAILSGSFSLTRAVYESGTTEGLDAVSNMIVVAVTVVAVFIRVLSHREVSMSTVMGAFLAYTLVGSAAAYLFVAVDAFSGQPFFNQGPQPEGVFIYFSFVTLTTVGFGDLSPATILGQRLVVIEALIGQVFLVVLVSRLVSLWLPPASRAPREEAQG